MGLVGSLGLLDWKDHTNEKESIVIADRDTIDMSTPTQGPEGDTPWLEMDARALERALAAVKPAVGRSGSAIEALRGVRVVSDDRGAHVWATRMDMACRRDVEWTDGSEEGFDSLVEHASLAKVVKALRGTITLVGVPDGDRSGLRLRDAKRTINVPGTPRPGDYPARPAFDGGGDILSGSAPALAAALQRVASCASTDETRPILTGVLVDTSDGGRLVATDSYRLAVCPLPGTMHDDAAALNLPAVALRHAAKHLAGGEHATLRGGDDARGLVTLSIDGGQTVWAFPPIEGKYPAWRQLLPDGRDIPIVMEADRLELADAAACIAGVVANNAPFQLTVRRGSLQAVGEHPDGLSVDEALPAHTNVWDHQDEEVTVGLNPGFLGAALGTVLEGDRVTIGVTNPVRPVLVRDAGESLVLIMPVRLNV